MKFKSKMIIVVLVLCCILVGYYFRKDLSEEWEKESVTNETIDLKSWQERNPDVYAWIRIDGTKIDYPVLQSSDTEDGFYLRHDIDRESNIYGALYSEKWNSKEFTDNNTIIYGHNMTDDSIFGSLKQYKDPEFFYAHCKIDIYTASEKLTYQVIAAYEYPAVYLPDIFLFDDDTEMKAYMAEIPEIIDTYGGVIDASTEIKAPLLTLSTCTESDSQKRMLVQAMLVDREKSEE